MPRTGASLPDPSSDFTLGTSPCFGCVESAGDVGFEFYLNPDTQLDLVVSHTFTDPWVATSCLVGLSRRWSLGRAQR